LKHIYLPDPVVCRSDVSFEEYEHWFRKPVGEQILDFLNLRTPALAWGKRVGKSCGSSSVAILKLAISRCNKKMTVFECSIVYRMAKAEWWLCWLERNIQRKHLTKV